MDALTAGVVVLAILAVVVVAGVARSRGWFRAEIGGPGNSKATVEGGPPSGIRARHIRAGRDMTARGRSVDARKLDVGRDVTLGTGEGGDDSPKA